MNTLLRSLMVAGACLCASAAMAEVKVTFAHPEKYTDMPFSPMDREQVLKDLSEHFGKLGLPADVNLNVEVLDLDLAGRLHMNSRTPHEIRVLNGGADWPTMRLHYTLERDGKVIASGEDKLKNMMYLTRLNRYSTGDSLRYEKQMLDDWYKESLSGRLAAR